MRQVIGCKQRALSVTNLVMCCEATLRIGRTIISAYTRAFSRANRGVVAECAVIRLDRSCAGNVNKDRATLRELFPDHCHDPHFRKLYHWHMVKPKVFICYCSQDSQAAKNLFDHL